MNDFKKENPLYSQLNLLLDQLTQVKQLRTYIYILNIKTPPSKNFLATNGSEVFPIGQLWISNQLHRTIRSPEFQ